MSPESVVTIELRCVYGFADVYTASESLPTPIEFTQRASCTLENGKVCRIMTKCGGGERGHISLLVHSQSTGALFSLWAYETGKMVIEVPEIKHTKSRARYAKSLYNKLSKENKDKYKKLIEDYLDKSWWWNHVERASCGKELLPSVNVFMIVNESRKARLEGKQLRPSSS